MSACIETPGNNTAAAFCAANPYLQAQVALDDLSRWRECAEPRCLHALLRLGGERPHAGPWSPTVQQPSATIKITGGGSAGGPIAGGTSITITGIGFVPGSTYVNFTEENNGVPMSVGSLAPVMPQSITTTSIVALSPAVSERNYVLRNRDDPDRDEPGNPTRGTV